jgi:hypothetical protein
MNKKILLLLLCLFPIALFSQNSTYFIKFSDKDTTLNPYSVDQPEQFLSNRAIQRRNKQNIKIDLLDLPVSPRYKDSIQNEGIQIINETKWLNGIVAEIPDSLLSEITENNFVEYIKEILPPPGERKSKKDTSQNTNALHVNSGTTDIKENYSDRQIKMLNGHALHQNGYRGKNMLISVIDGGFYNVTDLFDTLWNNNQILFTYDVHNRNNFVSEDNPHGTYVLSIMGGNIPNQFIGTAPEADYILIRSEVTSYEYLIEEYNWVVAAEMADSAGSDMINSSLGYTTFDASEQDHTYNDMNGDTTPAAIAADIASSRGMIVVVSAGNHGNNSWHYISTPADADSAITVGAVDYDGNYASLSSTGPSSDGDIKPTVAAMGEGTYFLNISGNIANGNGTSFASPIICGLTACLWQRYPDLKNTEIIDRIIENSSQFSNPDSLLGYGLPDFAEASGLEASLKDDQMISFKIYPNPFENNFILELNEKPAYDTIQLDVYSILGKKVYSQRIIHPEKNKKLTINELKDKDPGVYIIKIVSEEKIIGKKKIIKQ